ncbi:XRE family transcriptional regulator [Polynucleobacter sp. 71A-WALBACH]|uniref:XRE family transcriptional regulator n=1 Tax=Polynucleobacter sp. 71A-WALBACH TaxID=2689097 RepID=UPI001C0B2D48|nr:XRE family transcriptional regulator [Polynucleobacter sp. 71A-WALBACH]MBU3592911.1 XRE family transcriptional regulator [Polynucleobacter sp. 71A-WALBACH]
MTYQEFKNHLGKAGLTTYRFADITKMNRSSITNYSQKGLVPSHLALIAALLGEMKECRIDFESILEKIDIQPKKSRGTATGRFRGSPHPTSSRIDQ